MMDSIACETSLPLIQIIGAGQMGSSIGEVCALNGYSVHFIDSSPDAGEKASKRVHSALLKQSCRDRVLPQDVDQDSEDAPLAQSPSISSSDVLLSEPTQWIMEAAPEDFNLKKNLWFHVQSTVTAPHNGHAHTAEDHPFHNTFFASNTSSYSISDMAEVTHAPHRFIGLHFMNPAHKIPLLEIIRGQKTDADTYAAALKFAQTLHKTPITVGDTPGFVVNRLLIPMINDAVYVLHEGSASAIDIDHAMTLGAAHPMGPLKLADLIGLDTCLAIMIDLHGRLNSDKYRPCPLLIQHVASGKLGKKSGEGFYTYTPQKI